MTDAKPLDASKPRIYPSGDWLRSIEFVDATPEDGERAPVHVTQRVLFNGQDVAHIGDGVRVSNAHRLSLHTNGPLTGSELQVGIVVHEDDLVVPNYREVAAGAEPNQPMIGGLRVLIAPAVDVQHRWAVCSTDEHNKAWVRAWVMVTSCMFTSAHEPVIDGL